MNAATLRLGSRRSPMAMAQSRQMAELITARTGRPVDVIGVTTVGDVRHGPLAQIGGTGVFVSKLRECLLSGAIDLAVHSLKDLPTSAAEGITLAAVPARDDPRDALVGADDAKLADLPPGARIGTGSPRRAAQIRLLRHDVDCVPIRGNANTRVGRVRDGELDAVVLAVAGLTRLGFQGRISQVFEPEEMLPAPGQGALAVECRSGDPELAALLASVDDAASRAAVTAERCLLAALEAGCNAPVGGYATGTDRLRLDAVVLGSATAGGVPGAIRGHDVADATQAASLGRELAGRLLAQGAADLMNDKDDAR